MNLHPASQASAKDVASGLVCPDCRALLRQDGETLRCTKCPKTWPIVNGVPYFVENFPYWGEIPIEAMQEVNRQARAGSWKAALTDSTEPRVMSAKQMILNLERANWHLLLDLPRESRVLDLGAGTGTNSHALSIRFREVVALEPVTERIEFMQQRFAQEGRSNVQILRSSLWTLPFPDASFDLIAMNGVLEWVAEGSKEDPGEVQQRALRNALRLLKPGGYLYLGIENRLRFGSFIGYNDPHLPLPWVTILPRPLAHWYARKKGYAGYPNYLYSSSGYDKLLRKVGFSHVDCYLPLPDYNHPRYLLPLDDRIYSYYSRNFSSDRKGSRRDTLHAAVMKLGIMRHLEYSFAIMARK